MNPRNMKTALKNPMVSIWSAITPHLIHRLAVPSASLTEITFGQAKPSLRAATRGEVTIEEGFLILSSPLADFLMTLDKQGPGRANWGGPANLVIIQPAQSPLGYTQLAVAYQDLAVIVSRCRDLRRLELPLHHFPHFGAVVMQASALPICKTVVFVGCVSMKRECDRKLAATKLVDAVKGIQHQLHIHVPSYLKKHLEVFSLGSNFELVHVG